MKMLLRDGLALAAAAAGAVGAAGVLHLVIATQLLASAAPASALFGAFAAAQLFWVLPALMQWGRRWYYAGIAWNATLAAFFVATLVPNPATGDPVPPVPEDYMIQALQLGYVGLTVAMLVRDRRRSRLSEKEASRLK
jgi:hypothetical protein